MWKGPLVPEVVGCKMTEVFAKHPAPNRSLQTLITIQCATSIMEVQAKKFLQYYVEKICQLEYSQD